MGEQLLVQLQRPLAQTDHLVMPCLVIAGENEGPNRRLSLISQLMQPPSPPRRKIGFATDPDDNIIAHDRPARRHKR
jgi:hypothetical protein